MSAKTDSDFRAHSVLSHKMAQLIGPHVQFAASQFLVFKNQRDIVRGLFRLFLKELVNAFSDGILAFRLVELVEQAPALHFTQDIQRSNRRVRSIQGALDQLMKLPGQTLHPVVAENCRVVIKHRHQAFVAPAG